APQVPVLWDAAAYFEAGSSLAAGQLSSTARAFLGQRGPGYALFLAGVFSALPNDPWSVRFVQAVLGALACVLVCVVGRQLAGRRVGIIAGLLTAGYPPLILFPGRILTETLTVFLFVLGLPFMVRPRPRCTWLTAAGLTMGLAC